ncbi:MAG: Uma2 family endonuclease [Bryobacteraceae bacterium]
MVARTTLSLEDFLRLPEREPDGTHYELDEGHLIALSPTGGRHAFLMARITTYLDRVLDPNKFTVLCGDAGFILDETEDRPTVRGADVAVCAVPSEETDLPEGMLREAPLVAVEIVSESNTREDIERKTNQYLQFGCSEVWVLYPSTEETRVFRAGERSAEIYQRGKLFKSCLGIQVNTNRFFSR